MLKSIATAAALLLAASAIAQPVDRAKWYDGTTTTSDDPRRIPVPKGHGEPKGAILITNARLFDGTGAAARPAAILIEGSHITRIAASAAALTPPAGTVTIDAAGKTVMPGLIDLHSHVTYGEAEPLPDAIGEKSQAAAALRGQERLRYFIESGITSVRDTGSHGMSIFVLKSYVADGRIPGPRIFAAGQLIVGIGGHGTEGFNGYTAPANPDADIYEATGPDQWRAAVRQQFKNGADLIKLASQFSPDEVRAAVDEAHNLGLRVTVDSETIYAQMAVEAGVDCVEHPLPRSDETIRMMAAKGICSDITLVPYQIINVGGGYNFSSSRRFTESDRANFAMARKLKAAGVTLGLGTDLVAGWYKYLPEAYIQEMRNFGALGYSAAETLVTATRTNAEILGMADRLGTIAVGKLADIIIVDGRPDENVDALAGVDTVLVNGRVVVSGGRLATPRHVQEPLPPIPPPPRP